MARRTPAPLLLLAILAACGRSPSGAPPSSSAQTGAASTPKDGHAEMIARLQQVLADTPMGNRFIGVKRPNELKAALAAFPPNGPPPHRCAMEFELAMETLRLGDPEEAIRLNEHAL